VLGLLGGIIFWDGRGIVAERESTDDTNSTTTDPSSTAVVIDELRCQLQPERFDGGAWYTATVALLEDVGVRDGDVKQKIKYVLVELPAFGSVTVIAVNLVTPVNSTHELIVVHDRQWASKLPLYHLSAI
jgi:hypothetical protein